MERFVEIIKKITDISGQGTGISASTHTRDSIAPNPPLLREGERSHEANYFPEPVAVWLCARCLGSSLVMVRVCGVVAPVAVGLNLTVTFWVLPLGRLKVPLPLVTANGGSSVPIMTWRPPLPLFLILSFFVLVELTFTAPKLKLPETLNVPNGGVGVAVGVAV